MRSIHWITLGAPFPWQAWLFKWLPRLVTLVMVLLVAHSLAQLTWLILPAEAVRPPPPRADDAGLSVVGPGAGGPSAANLVKLHLFGEPARRQVTAIVPEAVPETHLKLVLRGVVAQDLPEHGGGAIIADPQGRERYYQLGDALPGGAKLEAIYPDRIILSRNQRLETLKLPKESVAADGKSVDSAVADAAPGPTLREYRDQLLKNPTRLGDLVAVRPVYHSGHLQGFRLAAVKDAALLERMGLQANDLVTMVNGISLDDPVKGLQVLHNLRDAQVVNLVVLRKGSPHTLTLRLDQ